MPTVFKVPVVQEREFLSAWAGRKWRLFCCAERSGGVQLHDGERRGVSGVNVTNPARRCPPLPPGEKQAEGIAADFCEKFGRRARHGEKIGRSAAGMALHEKNAASFRAEEVHKVLTESRDVGSFSY